MKLLQSTLSKIPVLNGVVNFILKKVKNKRFSGSEQYWEERYKGGGNSGSGSYNRLAEFKAKAINNFIETEKISTAIEFGCGDGNNLQLINYPKYIGLDVSPTAIRLNINKFKDDNSKSFYLYSSLAFSDNQKLFRSELTLSLDVIFHLVEDEIFNKYMSHLFQSSLKFVIIYSRDYSEKQNIHERSRNFSKWIDENQKSYKLVQQIDNPYPFDPSDPDNTSNANFYIYQKTA